MRDADPCNKFANIEILQTSTFGAELAIGQSTARLTRAGVLLAEWPATRIDVLTAEGARAGVQGAALVYAERATPEALAILREADVPYATGRGEWFLVAPPSVFVVQPPQRGVKPPRSSSPRLSKASVRAAKWLLLHRQVSPTVGELADETTSSYATASRAVHELAERRFVDLRAGGRDSRQRFVHLRDPERLLRALADDNATRTIRSVTWDIGVRTSVDAIERIAAVATEELPYALGELAGVNRLNPFVQAATVVVWVRGSDLDRWAERLDAEPASAAAGRVIARVAGDPWLVSAAQIAGGARVADPVQLFLDCSASGERALEAAELMRTRILA